MQTMLGVRFTEHFDVVPPEVMDANVDDTAFDSELKHYAYMHDLYALEKRGDSSPVTYMGKEPFAFLCVIRPAQYIEERKS